MSKREGKNNNTKYDKIEVNKDNIKTKEKKEEVKTVEERVKLDPIINDKVTKRKRGLIPRLITGIVGPEGLPGIGSYVAEEIIVPAIKNIIEDSVISGIGMILHGDSSRRGSRGVSRHNPNRYTSYGSAPRPVVNYTSRYTSTQPEPSRSIRSKGSSRGLEEYIITSREDASYILVALTEQADRYGSVSIADYYDLIGEPTEFTDNNYGWTDESILHAHVRPTRGGYVIKFPTPDVL